MRFVSTRGHQGRPTFYEILLGGLAPDGGLYLPETWPRLEVGPSYPATVANALEMFLSDSPLAGTALDLVSDAFAGFRHPEAAPLSQLSDGRFLLELFWGPTLAFKDHALQVLGRLFEKALAVQERRVTVLVATSGDTGSAAIAAGRGAKQMEVVVLYPKDRVSEFQRRQMTTVTDGNVAAVAVEGTFDDCQHLVKRAFADELLRRNLVAMNSINFARIVVQAAYYVWTASRVPGADFVVPTGNFGNVFSGWAAGRMRAPIGRLIIANNANHGLFDWVSRGVLSVEPVMPTLAPSMDIQAPSNLERYLFELAHRDSSQVLAWQEALRASGRIEMPSPLQREVADEFAASWFDDSQILAAIKAVYEKEQRLLDPHTALAWLAGNGHRRPGTDQVLLATADPAKFAPAIVEATGIEPSPPPGFAHLLTDPERTYSMPNDFASLAAILREREKGSIE
ncbi:MAG TPA: threonine synthase [Acidimicrobiia bacterium]|nr:threonine synthase [Acidimicrobiia bacterium]